MYRSTPIDCLHSILLGPYKYLTAGAMERLSPRQKKEISAKLSAFNYSGIGGKISLAITSHHKSFVGRDYKVWAQVYLFILGD
jgi:hypothetical protein